ncbi:ETC complex I subunit [Paracoccaceae bacterium GXU_MW_L88]
MRARIYRPARNAMQSGTAKTKHWVLEYVPTQAKPIDPLMGWTGSHDPSQQIRMRFDSEEEAVAYAEKNGIEFTIAQPKPRKMNVRPGGYGENFATKRRGPWTH